MQNIQNYNFHHKKVIVRVDFNVPITKDTDQVTDDKRIRAAVPTISYILSQGGSVILLSHFGRPKDGPEEKYSLKKIQSTIENILGMSIKFNSNCIGIQAELDCKNLLPGEVILMENVRFYKEETQGDISFAESLSHLGDCYVNDAFGTAHRAHASTAQIASFFPKDKMMGFLMKAEVDNAEKIVKNPEKPFVAIIGGAKVSDKVLIVENLLNVATDIIIGGGMAYTFSKALGGEIGDSLVEENRLQKALEIIGLATEKGVKIHLPVDSTVANSFSEFADSKQVKSNQIPNGWMGLDIGPKAIQDFKEIISKSRTILWNGPMGVFEWDTFGNGTKQIALSVAESTKKGAFSLIGGGDSASAIAKYKLENDVSYVSTGGGALLEFFEGKMLPGISALN